MQGGGEIGAGVFLCLKGEGMRAGEDRGSQGTRPELRDGAAEGEGRFHKVLGGEKVAGSSGRRKRMCTHSSGIS